MKTKDKQKLQGIGYNEKQENKTKTSKIELEQDGDLRATVARV